MDFPIKRPLYWLSGHGGIRAIMDDMKLLSTEAEGVREAIPEDHRSSLVNSSERVGALLGLQESRQDSSESTSEATGIPPSPPDPSNSYGRQYQQLKEICLAWSDT